ncbi:MAG: hypothetical protein ABI151_07745 [Chitinophagaceae bacterium]
MVKVYLLLRNNKQSGPFSIDELTSQNLRPMDLIWIEGKSAAWQYASEVNMLKQYLTPGAGNEKPGSADTHKSYLPKEVPSEKSPKIYVSLPGSLNGEKKAASTLSPSTVISSENKFETAIPVQSVRSPESKENLVTRYSSSLNEKEEAYTKWVYQKKSKTSGMSSELMGGIAVVVLLLMGTAAYLVKNNIQGEHGKELTATATRNTEELVSTVPPAVPVVSPISQATVPEQTESVFAPLLPVPNQEPAIKINPVIKTSSGTVGLKKKIVVTDRKPALAVKKADKQEVVTAPVITNLPDPIVKTSENNAGSSNAAGESKKTKKTFSEKVDGFFNRIVHAKHVEPGVPAAEKSEKQTEPSTSPNDRKASRRGDASVNPAPLPKKDLAAGLAVTTIDPSNDWMQGVHGMKVKIDNHNDVKISNASVEVRYFNEQNTVLEKKTIRLSDIPPGKSVTLPIPDHRLADHAEALLLSAGN